MKRIYLLFTFVFVCLCLGAQTFTVKSGNVAYRFPAVEGQNMLFSASGTKLTINGKTFWVDDITEILVDNAEVADKTVAVTYLGDRAEVSISGDVAQYVDAVVTGAHVVLTQSAEVGDNTCGEITYTLAGESANGEFSLSGTYKASLELLGLTLTNPTGAALTLADGKRVSLSSKSGTVNTLADGASGSQKGCIDCKGHLELKGKGVLNVTGNSAHGIYAKEYVTVKHTEIHILKAVKDGINCNQYFEMESGALTITSPGDDGVQVSYKDDTDREDEDTGTITVKDGTLTVTVAAAAAKCLKADHDICITGGTLRLTSNANGIWDATRSKTKASACLGADGDVTISGGVLELKATGSGGKGISCDGIFRSDGGNVTVTTTGGMLVYSNGTLNHNYTSSADRISSANKSSSKGIKADGGVVFNDGEYYITTATNNAEGVESKKQLDINGGTIFVKAYDDGINSSNDFRVSGGNLTVISTVGDGLDSNGNLTISGGYVRTMGAGGPEMGLDAATESGYAVYITGGTVFAFGGSNTYPTKSGSTQAYVRGSGSIKAETEISVKSGDAVLATFTVPEEYSSSGGTSFGPGGGGWRPGGGSGSGSILVSCPALTSGQSYTLMNGTISTTVSARLTN
ncbi:MAG: carbohydrate-binding domain-containing protein [Bacteroidaceae bacterium]|nr:carbohydrate-binding domain-containing protein [Bacteroidaceae bacterium]